MIKKIHHVGIAVNSIDETLKLFYGMFGFREIKTTDSQGAFKSSLICANDAAIELLEPTDSEGGIAKFLRERGEGLHHLSLEVDDVNRELKSLQEKGIRLIDAEPQTMGGTKVAFIYPAKGVLIELVQSC